MQSKESRREAAKQFKERKSLLGTYAIRCIASGRVWVGASKNLHATKNGSWFCLRNGNHQDKALQKEWKDQGEPTFQYEILESLEEDVHPLEVDDRLKEMKSRWMIRLDALPLR